MIQLTYSSGRTVTINEHPLFYMDGKTNQKISKSYMAEKLLDLAASNGSRADLYHAVLTNGDILIEKGPYLHNKPEVEADEKIDYSQQLKDLKASVGNRIFTQLIRRDSEGVSVMNINKAA